MSKPVHRVSGFLHALLTALFAFTLYSCEDVIQLDLSDIESQIVIEGIVSDTPSASKVTVSITQSAFEKSQPHNVTGAAVMISDDRGTTEALKETQTGVFVPTAMNGVAGRTYHLSVTVGGQQFMADSRMPAPVVLDSIKSVSSFSWFTLGTTTLQYYLTDNPAVEEYCVIKVYNQNGSPLVWNVYSDKNAAGRHVVLESPEFTPTSSTIIVEVLSVDKAAYEYFYSLRQVVGNSLSVPDMLRMSDYNPKSNLSNNALGYFSAQSTRRYTVSIR